MDYHAKKFGLSKTNVEFIEGEIDRLEETKLKENSVDVVVYVTKTSFDYFTISLFVSRSNSVVNYRRDKKAIIEGACKILKVSIDIAIH